MHPPAASTRLPVHRSTGPGLPARFRIALGLGLFFVVLGTLDPPRARRRGRGELPHSIATLGRIFAAGALLDLWVAAWCVLPWVLYLALLPERWWQARWQKGGALRGPRRSPSSARCSAPPRSGSSSRSSTAGSTSSPSTTCSIRPRWSPTSGRATRREGSSPPWRRWSLGLTFVLRRPLARAWERPTPFRERFALLCAHAGVLAVLAVSVSPRPLVEHSPDRLVRELTSNGTYAFGEALLGLDAPYDGFYATRDEARDARAAGSAARRSRPRRRSVSPRTRAPAPSGRSHRQHPWNVVLLLEESLGAEFIGALHPRQDPDGDLAPHPRVRCPRPRRDALHPGLLNRQPDDPGDRGHDLLAAAPSRGADRLAPRRSRTSSPCPACSARTATRRSSSTAAGRSSTAWAPISRPTASNASSSRATSPPTSSAPPGGFGPGDSRPRAHRDGRHGADRQAVLHHDPLGFEPPAVRLPSGHHRAPAGPQASPERGALRRLGDRALLPRRAREVVLRPHSLRGHGGPRRPRLRRRDDSARRATRCRSSWWRQGCCRRATGSTPWPRRSTFRRRSSRSSASPTRPVSSVTTCCTRDRRTDARCSSTTATSR